MTINHEALKKRRAGSRMSGFGWKAKENGNKVRILPPHSRFLGNWDAMTDLAITFRIHYFRVEGKQTEVSRCLEELKQRCPACEMFRIHKKSTDPGMQEMAKSIRAADQYLFNILDINDLQKGIQAWPANYTCWDKVMEIAANPAWGNVVDPANGVNFEITMTPGNRSRTGHNQYSVMPEPQRTTVDGILATIEGWQAKLDVLDEQINPAKTPEEITELLLEMGFPPVGGGGTPRGPGGGAPVPVPSAVAAVPAPAAVTIPGATPAAVPATPQPAAVPASAPVAVPAPAPVAVPAESSAVAIPSAAPVEIPAAVAAVPAKPKLELMKSDDVHYDPGPDFQVKVSADQRPANSPRCFGDYEPSLHRCQPCPVVVDCQLQMLGVREA